MNGVASYEKPLVTNELAGNSYAGVALFLILPACIRTYTNWVSRCGLGLGIGDWARSVHTTDLGICFGRHPSLNTINRYLPKQLLY